MSYLSYHKHLHRTSCSNVHLSSCLTFFISSFNLLYNLPSSFLQPFFFLLLLLCFSVHWVPSKPDQLALDVSSLSPARPVFTPCFYSCPLAESKRGEQLEEWDPWWTQTCRACVMWWGLAQGSLDQTQLSVITAEGVRDFSLFAQISFQRRVLERSLQVYLWGLFKDWFIVKQ